MTQEEKYIKLTTKDVKKLITSLAVPTVLTMLITTFYSMADAYFVGTINASAQGAISVVYSFMAIIQAFGFFFGHGSGNYISRSLGERNNKEAEKMASTGFFSALFFGFLLMIFGLIFIEPLAMILGSTETIKPYAVDYLKYILIGAPYMTASLVLNNQLRFQGSAVYAMAGIVTGGILNIGLDAIFVTVLDMGTAGAGLATAISQLISFCLLLIGTLNGGNIKISVKKIQLKLSYYKEMLRGGLPSLGRQSIASIATICLNYACKTFSPSYTDQTIAALGNVFKIINFFSSAMIGFGQGFQPVCGFNYGAKKYDRVLKGFRFSVVVCTCFALTVSFLGFIFSKFIVGLFSTDLKVIEISEKAMRFQCVSFFLTGFVTISNMMLQNIGKVFSATALAVTRQGLAYIPVMFIMGALFGVSGLEISQAIADVISFLICIPLTIPVIKSLIKNKG